MADRAAVLTRISLNGETKVRILHPPFDSLASAHGGPVNERADRDMDFPVHANRRTGWKARVTLRAL